MYCVIALHARIYGNQYPVARDRRSTVQLSERTTQKYKKEKLFYTFIGLSLSAR
jgi:hypothetical protein